MTNYQRTANWLKAAGKQPHNDQHTSVQLGCHLEEIAEQLECINVGDDALYDAIETIKSVANAIKSGRVLAYIPQRLRTDFLKELCDGKITADGVAYQLGADMDEADTRVIDSNWSKFDECGAPVFLEGGKIGRSKQYKKANLRGLV